MSTLIKGELNSPIGEISEATKTLLKFTLSQEVARVVGKFSEYMSLSMLIQVCNFSHYSNSI